MKLVYGIIFCLFLNTFSYGNEDFPSWEVEEVEDFELPDDKHLCMKVQPNKKVQDDEMNLALTTLEAGPATIVAGCVNVISGDFVDSQIDLTVPGSVPLAVQRTYCSSQKKWQFRHKPVLHATLSGGENHVNLLYTDDQGATMPFRTFDINYPNDFSVCSNLFEKGLTNCGSGEISGKTNLKNSTVSLLRNDDEKKYCLRQGSHAEKTFSRVKRKGEHHKKGAPIGKFLLEKEIQPNGNQIRYEYNDNDSLRVISAFSNLNEILATITIRFFAGKSYWQSDAGKVTYKFKDSAKELIEESDPTNAIPVSYIYHPDNRIAKKKLPDERYLIIDYHDFHDSWRKKPVYRLWAPVGPDQTPVCTHLFHYSKNEVLEHERGNRFGVKYLRFIHTTLVLDAEKNRTTYYYNDEDRRLYAIEKHDPNKNLLSQDKFFWSEKGNLTARSFHDDKFTYFCRTLDYDRYFNVKQETLWGNLTGNNAFDVVVDKKGIPLDNGCENYTKTREFSKDGWNLLLQEDDGRKKIRCSYYKNSNLLKERFTLDGEKILKREFFEYESGVVVKEIWDDGTSSDAEDMTDVTERHFKLTTLTKEFPIGLPHIVEERHQDSNKQVLLKKEVNTYSSQGKLKQQEHYDSTDRLVYTLYWDYDHLGNVIKQVNALGEISHFTYDANGSKITEKNDEISKIFTYDFANRLILEEEIWPNGKSFIKRHRYNTLSQKIAMEDIYGNETIYRYDALGRVIETQHPPMYGGDEKLAYPTEKTEYDAMGNAITKRDAAGKRTRIKYTLRGQPYFIKYPNGSIENKNYTLDGLLEREVAKNGLITTYTYDALGRITQTTTIDLDGTILKTATATYNSFNLLSETDESGLTTTYSYDAAGRKISMTIGSHVTKYEYDTLGRLSKTIESIDNDSVRVTIQEYDLLDRVIEERIEDGNGNVLKKEQYKYNLQGKRTHLIAHTHVGETTHITHYLPNGEPYLITDALENSTHVTYEHDFVYKDQSVLRTITTDPLGNQEIKIFDTHSRISCLMRQNAFGEITQKETFVYNLIGKKTLSIATVYPQAYEVVTNWQYDSMGNLIHLMEAKGTNEQKTTHYHFNSFGQKERTELPNGTILYHTYDILGLLKTYRSSDGSIEYSYNYNVKDLPILIIDHIHNTSTRRDYDEYSRLILEALDHENALEYAYDHLGRLTTLTLPDQSQIHYHRNALHLIGVERNSYTHHYQDYDLAGNISHEQLIGQAGTISYQYDQLQRPISTNTPVWKEIIQSFDPVGNLLKRHVIDAQGPLDYSYTYDDLYQLTSETGAENHNYQNDSLYNRRSKDSQAYTLNHLNQLLHQSNYHYTYDNNGNLKQKTSETEIINYRYDALDRLIEVQNGPQVTTYTYDSNHRRLAKTTNGISTQFLYQGQNEIGAIVGGKISQLRVLGMSYGAEIGAAVLLELDGKTFVPIHDSFGSIVAILEPSGKLITSYRYSAFGEMQAYGQAFDNPWSYSSKRFDTETGFYFFGRRYYDPAIGRWITPDPLGFEDGPNLYAYVHNHPLAFVDPDGQFAFLIAPVAYYLAQTAIGMVAEACLPALVAYCGESAAGMAIGAFATGVVKGYNGGTFDASSYGGAGWGNYLAECGGKMVGTMLSSTGPKGFVNASSTVTNMAAREGTQLVEKAIVNKGAQVIASNVVKNQTKNAATNTIKTQVEQQGQNLITMTPKILDGNSKWGMNHVLKRHAFEAEAKNASKFLPGIGKTEISEFVNTACKQCNGWKIEKNNFLSYVMDTGKAIGTRRVDGTLTSEIKIILKENKLYTAYPN